MISDACLFKEQLNVSKYYIYKITVSCIVFRKKVCLIVFLVCIKLKFILKPVPAISRYQSNQQSNT